MAFKVALLASVLALSGLPAVAQVAPVILNNPTNTGGSMDSTAIGLTTPATGAFTALSATGQLTLTNSGTDSNT